MSVDRFVFLRQDTLPSLQQWQGSLNWLGIDLAFDSTIKVKEHAGYLPANLGNVPTGFEFFTGSITESFPGALPGEVSGCDLVATITTHSDLRH